MIPKVGEWYTDGNRSYKVVKVDRGIVTFWDIYQKGYVAKVAATRETSLLQWEADVASGALRRTVKVK